MLKDRILATLKFFDLQDLPLTLFELHKFLLADANALKPAMNQQWELIDNDKYNNKNNVSIAELAKCLDEECKEETEQKSGYVCLRGRSAIIDQRLANYSYGIRREKLVRKFIRGLRHMPFVRGVALAGSQALGQQREASDIDLLIIVDQKFLWLARTGVTAYFHFLGKRRHGKRIANRFCLNHYLAGVKTISELKNLYTASEYAKLRPLVYADTIRGFQNKNRGWITAFLPNFEPMEAVSEQSTPVQQFFERLLSGGFGQWLEAKLKNWQLPRIRQEEFILVREDELSFHPESKQKELLEKFFSTKY